MLKNHAEETKIKTLVYSNTLLSKCWQIYIYLYDDMYINTYEKMHTLPHFTTRKRLKQNQKHTRIKVPSPSKWHPIHSIWNTHFNNHFHILYLFFFANTSFLYMRTALCQRRYDVSRKWDTYNSITLLIHKHYVCLHSMSYLFAANCTHASSIVRRRRAQYFLTLFFSLAQCVYVFVSVPTLFFISTVKINIK